jgi:hypothetical protein
MIVHGCLERDYCKANGIDAATHFTTMRHEFERYRDRFGSNAAMESSTRPIDDYCSTPQLSIVRCVAFLACLLLSCLAVCSWQVWLR